MEEATVAGEDPRMHKENMLTLHRKAHLVQTGVQAGDLRCEAAAQTGAPQCNP